METYFNSFQQDEQIHQNSCFSTVDEVIKDQLNILESIKADENIILKEQTVKNTDLSENEDFHQLMSDWQQHVELLHSIDSGDLGLSLDPNGDALNKNLFDSLLEERENTSFSKTLKCSLQKKLTNNNSTSVLFGSHEIKREPFVNDGISTSNFQNCQKLCELLKGENRILGKVTVLNGEKEILGKNIIELHCLNEIKEDTQDNCQVASTVINGKRYKIIIKPKSLKMKKLNNSKAKKNFIKKLKCNPVIKLPEPKEDEIISEMRNGNYNVPLLESDNLLNWNLVNLDSEWNKQIPYDCESPAVEKPESETVSKISTLHIQIPKNDNEEQEKDVKKRVDKKVETTLQHATNSIGNLVKNCKNKNKTVISQDNSNPNFSKAEANKIDQNSNISYETTKNNSKHSLRKNDVSQRNVDCKVPLFQVPLKKTGKCSIRMQDAVAMMNKNKLLKIVSSGDTISLDHDYCRTINMKTASGKETKKLNTSNEKKLKKDNGMESGDVSNTNEGVNPPENFQNLQSIKDNNSVLENYLNKKEEERQVEHETHIIESNKKNLFFLNSKSTENKTWISDISDSVKTELVSNGTKALTNCVSSLNLSSEISNNNPNFIEVNSEIDYKKRNPNEPQCENEKPKKENVTLLESNLPERSKKKLKLEEYLNRRNIREKERAVLSNESSTMPDKQKPQEHDIKASNAETQLERTQYDSNECNNMLNDGDIKKKKTSYCDDSRSSSTLTADKNSSIRDEKSQSKLVRKIKNRNSSDERNCYAPEKQYNSRKQSFWSGSSSRSSSSESCSSSDYSSNKKCRNSFRSKRNSRSRSPPRRTSKFQSRDYSFPYDRSNSHLSPERRSRSPYRAYSFREKQRQIEERRVIYVGRIEEGMTNAKLRQRFSIFGPVIDISLHFREYGDNYGFVTYAYKSDAYDAVEHGNDDPSLPRYDLCFGGRRGFCKEKYADLDGMPTSYSNLNDSLTFLNKKNSFDVLLREAQAKLKSRKKQ